ncbi:MAG TPA: FeoA family protein [Clostridia bacterium]|nr:ferrous iron transport protein A [Clostridiaceae bacterium]HOF26463.1 FeoA family protein [Clostridia bacterium]HOM34077.1 FeoA family protein [Clostridia bacterium]HOR89656.1 FeoA family protein [Clostridia bacterium]HOT71164.1 FeoA family protein [Clostridia bacterium]
MMPLISVKNGEKAVIKKVTGSNEVRKYLTDLGFVEGSDICVITEIMGNMIVNIKECRIALNRELASKIMVEV